MSDTEMLGAYQHLADDMSSLIHSRIAAATPIEVLSQRGDKLLQVVEESDGQRFVTRSFQEDAVKHVEGRGMTFVEAWEAMHIVFSDVGIDVMPNTLYEQEGEYPFTAVSEYLPDEVDMIDVPTETKKAIAYSLGQLLKAESTYLPAPEMVNGGMFQPVRQQDGSLRVVMVDVDPHIIKNPKRGRDMLIAHYIERFGDLIWEEWCTETERQDVIVSLVLSLNEALGDSLGDVTSRTGEAFMNVHMMSKGLNPKELGLFKDR